MQAAAVRGRTVRDGLIQGTSVRVGSAQDTPLRYFLTAFPLVRRHPVSGKAGGSLQHRTGCLQHFDHESRAGSLADCQMRIQHRVKSQGIRKNFSRAFPAEVRGNQESGDAGNQPLCQKRRRLADKAVEDNGHVVHCPAKTDSNKSRDVQAAEVREHRQWIRQIFSIIIESLADDLSLPCQAAVGQAGTAPRSFFRRKIQQRTEDRRRGRGIADPHLAGSEQGESLFLFLPHQSDPRADRGKGLCSCHGGFLTEIGGSGADSLIDHPRHGISHDSEVDN